MAGRLKPRLVGLSELCCCMLLVNRGYWEMAAEGTRTYGSAMVGGSVMLAGVCPAGTRKFRLFSPNKTCKTFQFDCVGICRKFKLL